MLKSLTCMPCQWTIPFTLKKKKKSQFLVWIICLHSGKACVIPVPQTKHNLLPNFQIPKKADSYSANNILTKPQKWWPSIKIIELKKPEHFSLFYKEPPFVCSRINTRAVSIPNQNHSLAMAMRYLQNFFGDCMGRCW